MATAVVTGASGTLGGEVVALLAETGLDVVAVSRSGRGPNRGESRSIAADLSVDESIDVVRAAISSPVAVVVHALGLPASPSVLEAEPGLLAVGVNLKAGGLLRLIRAVDGRFAAGARVIAVGGHLGAEPSELAPLAGVANAALANLVRQLVRPLAGQGATVHLIAPGPFDSPRVDGLLQRRADHEGISTEQARAELLSEYPGGVMPTARQVAELIVSLTQSYGQALNGGTIFADGGIKHSIF